MLSQRRSTQRKVPRGADDKQVLTKGNHYVWHTFAFDGDRDIWTTGEDAIVVRMGGGAKHVRYEFESYVLKTFDDVLELAL